MATKKKTSKKKTSKKSTKAKKTAAGKVKAAKRQAPKGKNRKKPAKRVAAPKKAAAKKAVAKKKPLKKTVKRNTSARSEAPRKGTQGRRPVAFSRDRADVPGGEESGDLQGLSNVESADSESVDELLEEGNAFEAGVVGGVEDADGHDEQEVHTREVPEDDVPAEYLDED
jgi:hypothetical protein